MRCSVISRKGQWLGLINEPRYSMLRSGKGRTTHSMSLGQPPSLQGRVISAAWSPVAAAKRTVCVCHFLSKTPTDHFNSNPILSASEVGEGRQLL